MNTTFILRIHKYDNYNTYYEISNSTYNGKEKIYIRNQEGEGGTFDSKKFFESVNEFFKENF